LRHKSSSLGARLAAKSGSLYSSLPVFLFMFLGVLAGVVLLTLIKFFTKHSPRYGEVFLFAALFVVPPILFYHWAAFRQGFRGFRITVTNLYWYHWLWLLLFASMLAWRKRDISEIRQAPVDTFAALRLVLVTFVGCILLMRLFTRKTDYLKSWLRGIPGLLMVFVLVVLSSTLWSIYWQWTLYKGCEYAVDVALLAAILAVVRDAEEFKNFFDWTWIWLGWLLTMCWIGALIWPEIALSHNLETGGTATGPIAVQLSGVFPDLSANRVGEYSAILTAVALVRLLPVQGFKRVMKSWYLWLFLAGFITMVFAQTRSATGGFLVAVFLVFLLSGRFKHGVAVVVLAFFLITITGSGTLLIDYMRRGQSNQEIESLTGRLQWWEFAYKKYSDTPFTGYGAYAAGRFLVMGSFGNNIASMHSDWVETMAGCGFWGIAPLLIVMVMGWWYLLRFVLDPSRTPLERQLALEAIAVLAVATMRTVFSTDLTWHLPVQFWVSLGYAEFLRRRYAHSPFYISAPAYVSR
jgi:O-antigen ligase